MIRRAAYFLYYLKELDRGKFAHFLDHAAFSTSRPKSLIMKDILAASFKYNISILEYFNFRFYEISDQEKETFAGTGYMYEYQRRMNPPGPRRVLEDKLAFLKEYAAFARRSFVSMHDLRANSEPAERVLANKSGKIVLKNSKGQCGRGLKVIDAAGQTATSLAAALKATKNDYAEEFVTQHKDLMALSPAGLNTIRIITQLNKRNEVDLLGCRLRLSVDSAVDNLAAGNIAAAIDETTGTVTGPAVYGDITKADETRHPITGAVIQGFKVPLWDQALAMAKRAALANTGNRSVGWDVAITDSGPELIEGKSQLGQTALAVAGQERAEAGARGVPHQRKVAVRADQSALSR